MQVSVLTVKAISMPVVDRPFMYRSQRGFTLIESVIGIVVFGFAMILMTTTVFPMFAHSPNSHYEARASSLGQSILSKVSAAQFDTKSDGNGSRWRCGENGAALRVSGIFSPANVPACSSELKAPENNLPPVSIEDYIGCWGDVEAECTPPGVYRGKLSSLVSMGPSGNESIDYSRVRVEINVSYDENTFVHQPTNPQLYKRIDVAVITPKNGSFDFTSYRSNY